MDRLREYAPAVLLLALIPALALAPVRVPAQGNAPGAAEGGFTVGLDYTEQLLYEDDETSLRSIVDLDLASRTRTQALSLSLGAGFDKRFDDGLEVDVVTPRALLDYALERRNTALGFNLQFRRVDINDLAFVEEAGELILVFDDGEREDISAGLTVEFGRVDPFGATISLSQTETTYIDSVSPTLIDTTTSRAGVVFRFNLSPVTTAFVDLDALEEDRDGGIDVSQTSVRARVETEVNPVLTATAYLGQTRVERSGSVPRSVEDGVVYGLGLALDRPNGAITGSLDSDIDENGLRTTLRLDRRMELPRGSLSFGVGLSRDDETDTTDPLYNVAYVRDMPRGQFRASFAQSFTTASDGTEVLDSRLSLSLQQELTELSSLGATLNLREGDRSTAGAGDTRQIDVGLNYTHTLTRDWSLVGGISRSFQQEENQPDQTEDRVFLGLSTSLGWRP